MRENEKIEEADRMDSIGNDDPHNSSDHSSCRRSYALPDPQTVELSEGEIASVSFHNKPIEIGTKATVEGEKEVDPLDKVTLTDS